MTATTTLTPPPDDGHARPATLPDPPKPPDAMQQSPHIFRAYEILDAYFKDRPDVLVAGRGYLCSDIRDRSRWISMDCVVAFAVDPEAIIARNGYIISEVGKPPEFVLEVVSESTSRQDYIRQRALYAEYGVAEYWCFDRTGGEYHDAPLSGDRLVNGRYEPIRIHTGTDGVLRGYSPVLRLELHWDAGQLRFRDPAVVGHYLPDLREALAQRDAETAARAVAEAERDIAAAQRDVEAKARAAAEALVERLRAQLRRLQSD